MRRTGSLISIVFVVTLVSATSVGCADIFGAKSDSTTDEIFDAGRIPPGLFSEVEYVPLFPFFATGGNGAPFDEPVDVYVGFDQFIYVADRSGLHVLDIAGRPANFIPIAGGATSVTQDRMFRVYVTGRRDTTLDGRTWSLPVVTRYVGVSTGSPRVDQTLWHPFDDDSRRFNRPEPLDTDEQVEFTGVAVLASNDIYVSRRGPVNDPRSVILPHNTVLEFTDDGVNTQAVPLSPTRPNLRSSLDPADVLTVVHPPQREFFSDEKHFVIAQTPPPGESLRFAVLSIRAVLTPDGIVYQPDSDKLQVSANPDRGDGFLYDEFRFERPADLAFAADATQYFFVIDSAKDSLFVFTNNGIEGVAPPPGSSSSKPVPVSFGGSGDGALEFNNPKGVAYFNRIVYVADTGNSRISRFRLNTDFE